VLLMTTIEERVRRPLCVSPPTCLGYARDEQHLVTACGISPAAPDIAAKLLGELVIAPRVVAAAIRVLNFSFAREGLHFPMRLRDADHNLDDWPSAPPCTEARRLGRPIDDATSRARPLCFPIQPLFS
jgi:hypothetical protein